MITEQKTTESDKVFHIRQTARMFGFDLSDAINERLYRLRSNRSGSEHLCAVGWIRGINHKQFHLGKGRSSLEIQ